MKVIRFHSFPLPSLMYYASAVIDSRKKRTKEGTANQSGNSTNPSTSLFLEQKPSAKSKTAVVRTQNRLTHAQLRELETQKEKEVVRGYRRVKELWPRMLGEQEGQEDAEREWLVEAEKLVDTFRETRNLFSTSRVCTGIFWRIQIKL